MGIASSKAVLHRARHAAQPRVAVVDEAFVANNSRQEALANTSRRWQNQSGRRNRRRVAHVKHFGLDATERVQPQLYLAFNQAPDDLLPFLAPRIEPYHPTTADPLNLTAAVRRQVQALDPINPVYVSTMERTLDEIACHATTLDDAARVPSPLLL